MILCCDKYIESIDKYFIIKSNDSLSTIKNIFQNIPLKYFNKGSKIDPRLQILHKTNWGKIKFENENEIYRYFETININKIKQLWKQTIMYLYYNIQIQWDIFIGINYNEITFFNNYWIWLDINIQWDYIDDNNCYIIIWDNKTQKVVKNIFKLSDEISNIKKNSDIFYIKNFDNSWLKLKKDTFIEIKKNNYKEILLEFRKNNSPTK